jgi:hypothetical protein
MTPMGLAVYNGFTEDMGYFWASIYKTWASNQFTMAK